MFSQINAEWISHTLTALGTAVVSLFVGGASVYYYIRNRHLKLVGDEAELKRIQDANTTKAWREIVDFKTEEFRKKNEDQDKRQAAYIMESDKRASAMLQKMDEMHAAHLKCEREGLEREIAFKREAADREIAMKRHEARIADLTEQLDKIRTDVSSLNARQTVTEHNIPVVELKVIKDGE